MSGTRDSSGKLIIKRLSAAEADPLKQSPSSSVSPISDSVSTQKLWTIAEDTTTPVVTSPIPDALAMNPSIPTDSDYPEQKLKPDPAMFKPEIEWVTLPYTYDYMVEVLNAMNYTGYRHQNKIIYDSHLPSTILKEFEEVKKLCDEYKGRSISGCSGSTTTLYKDVYRQFYAWKGVTNLNGVGLLEIALSTSPLDFSVTPEIELPIKDNKDMVITPKDAQLILLLRNYQNSIMTQGGESEIYGHMVLPLGHTGASFISAREGDDDVVLRYAIEKRNGVITLESEREDGLKIVKPDDENQVCHFRHEKRFKIIPVKEGDSLKYKVIHQSIFQVSKDAWVLMLKNAHLKLNSLVKDSSTLDNDYLMLIPLLIDDQFRKQFVRALIDKDIFKKNIIVNFLDKSRLTYLHKVLKREMAQHSSWLSELKRFKGSIHEEPLNRITDFYSIEQCAVIQGVLRKRTLPESHIIEKYDRLITSFEAMDQNSRNILLTPIADNDFLFSKIEYICNLQAAFFRDLLQRKDPDTLKVLMHTYKVKPDQAKPLKEQEFINYTFKEGIVQCKGGGAFQMARVNKMYFCRKWPIPNMESLGSLFYKASEYVAKPILEKKYSSGCYAKLNATMVWVQPAEKETDKYDRVIYAKHYYVGTGMVFIVVYNSSGIVDKSICITPESKSFKQGIFDKERRIVSGSFSSHEIPLRPDESFVVVGAYFSKNSEKQISASKPIDCISELIYDNRDADPDKFGLLTVKAFYKEGLSESDIALVRVTQEELNHHKIALLTLVSSHGIDGEKMSDDLCRGFPSALNDKVNAHYTQFMTDQPRMPIIPAAIATDGTFEELSPPRESKEGALSILKRLLDTGVEDYQKERASKLMIPGLWSFDRFNKLLEWQKKLTQDSFISVVSEMKSELEGLINKKKSHIASYAPKHVLLPMGQGAILIPSGTTLMKPAQRMTKYGKYCKYVLDPEPKDHRYGRFLYKTLKMLNGGTSDDFSMLIQRLAEDPDIPIKSLLAVSGLK